MQRNDRHWPLLDAFFLRLEQHDRIMPEERAALEAALLPSEILPEGSDLVNEGDRPGVSTLLLDGLAFRYRLLQNGARQIVALHIAGDFVDLHSFPLKEMDHSVGALTRVVIAKMPHAALIAITEQFPHLTRMLWLLTLIDAAITREWAVGLGRRSAIVRMAHLFCEIHVRLEAIGRDGNDTIDLPITQQDLGDMLGLSPVHTNRVLQELRSRALLSWQGSTVKLLDREALRKLAEFDDIYLHRVREPR
ncbi:MAG: Crp/Fnr family transcriptional regulator [Devosia sp.]|nr:Crp/Fnr family transcriptional regulator [Devosia sp.]